MLWYNNGTLIEKHHNTAWVTLCRGCLLSFYAQNTIFKWSYNVNSWLFLIFKCLRAHFVCFFKWTMIVSYSHFFFFFLHIYLFSVQLLAVVNQRECGLYSPLLFVLSYYCVRLMHCVPGTKAGSFVLVRVVWTRQWLYYIQLEAELFPASFPIHEIVYDKFMSVLVFSRF